MKRKIIKLNLNSNNDLNQQVLQSLPENLRRTITLEQCQEWLERFRGNVDDVISFLQFQYNSQHTIQNETQELQNERQIDPLFLFQNRFETTEDIETKQDEQFDEISEDKITFDRISQILNSINGLQEVENSQMKISELFDQVQSMRRSPIFSFDILELVKYLNENSTEKMKFEMSELKKLDQSISDMKRTENMVKSNVNSQSVDSLIKKRDELRKYCFEMLTKVCPKLNQVVLNQENDKSVQNALLNTKEKLLVEQKQPIKTQLPKQASLEYFDWMEQFDLKMSNAIAKTNKCYEEFQLSMIEEKLLHQEMLQNSQEITSQIVFHANNKKPDQNSIMNLNHLQNMYIYYQNTLEFLKTTLEKKKNINSILSELPGLKQQQRESKRVLLKLKYRKEELILDGGSKTLLAQLDDEISKCQTTVSKFDSLIESYEKEMLLVREDFYPELEKSQITQEILPHRIMDSKFKVNRSIKDYVIVKTISNNVSIVSFADLEYICKSFSLGNEKTKKLFIKEIGALSRLNHPCIVKVVCFFIEDENVYVLTEYHKEGNLSEYLTKNPSVMDLKTIFHLVAQGIKHVHDSGIIHCDIKPENIVLNNLLRPILIDFDISRDLERSLTKTIKDLRGTTGFVAPEVLEGKSPTPASDIWSFGCLIFKILLKKDPVLLPNQPQVSIPQHDNLALKDLLAGMLKRDPTSRFTADEVISHDFFISSLEKEIFDKKMVVSTDLKMSSLSRFLFHFKKGQSKIVIKLNRSNLVNDVLSVFTKMQPVDLIRKLQVEFVDEIGADLGGLTTNMYTDFFKNITSSNYGLFESPSENNLTFLPQRNFEKPEIFYVIGKVLIKSIYDQRVLPEVFPTALFQFLCGNSVNFRDLEIFDPQMAHSLNQMMNDNIDDMGFDFEEFDEISRSVTQKNKNEFFQKKVFHYLIGSRRRCLEELENGFNSIQDLNLQLTSFAPHELQILIFGQELLDCKFIVDLLKFEGFDDDAVATMFISVLQELTNSELRSFVEFVTGQCGIGSDKKKILINKARNVNALPVAHVCGWQLDLPEYANKIILKSKLMMAMQNGLDGGFHRV